MFIQTETTPNPESLKFLPGQIVLDEKYGTGMVSFGPLASFENARYRDGEAAAFDLNLVLLFQCGWWTGSRCRD
jgi:hypothetical protein